MSRYTREDFLTEAKNATHAYDMIFMDACDKIDVPWRLMKAQGFVESRLNPQASSRIGARGVMQLVPATFRDMAGKFVPATKIIDPWVNIHAGVKYFTWCRERFAGPDRYRSIHNDLAFASYLCGWHAVKVIVEREVVPVTHRSGLIAALEPAFGNGVLQYIEDIDTAYAVFSVSR